MRDIGDIRLEDTDIVAPREGEARIRVEAAGVCGSDIPRIYKDGAHTMPIIPGHEFAGVVEDIGAGVEHRWLNARVGVYPLISCGECDACVSYHPEMCRNYDYIGSRRDGAFAEYVTAPVSNLLMLPKGVTFKEAAMLEPMAVAVHAVRMGVEGYDTALPLDARIVVCGMGAIGLLVVMFLRERGFNNVCCIGNRDGQRSRAAALGISDEDYCDIREEDAADWIKKGSEAPALYFECSGSNESLNYAINGAGAGTWIVLVGNPKTDMTLSRDTYSKLLRNGMAVFGSWNSTFFDKPLSGRIDDWRYALERLARGRVNPSALVTHEYSLDMLGEGFEVMKNKTEDYCKVMMLGENMNVLR